MSDVIKRYLEQLAGSFARINPEIERARVEALQRQRDIQAMVDGVKNVMALEVALRLEEASNQADGMAMWFEAPDPLPPIGSPELASLTVGLRYSRRSFGELPVEIRVSTIAHVLAGLVLRLIQHPLRHDGKAIDLTAMIYGFRDFGEFEVGLNIEDIAVMALKQHIGYKMAKFGYLTGAEAIYARQWLTANRERIARENLPLAELAARLRNTQHVEDSIELLRRAGGSFATETRGRLFRKDVFKVAVGADTVEFASLYDMSQWVIANLLPKIPLQEEPGGSVSKSILRR